MECAPQNLLPAMALMLLALAGRSVCNLGFVERPMVIAFLWWLWTGELYPALPLGIFFELFWLDLFPIGSFIAPMPAFPFLLLLALSRHLDWVGPVTLAFPLAVSLPLAYVVPLIEFRQRNIQKTASSVLVAAAHGQEALGSLPGRLVRRSMAQHLGFGVCAFLALYAAVALLYSLPFIQRNAAVIPLDVDWSVLYAIAAIGSLLALRIKKVYLAFALCMAGFLLLKFF